MSGVREPSRVDTSFRDPSGRVMLDGERVLRYLTPTGRDSFVLLRDSGLLDELTTRRYLVPSQDVTDSAPVQRDIQDVALVLEHERIPFVSYAYEWPFELLRAAALQYLDTVRLSLARGLILKDATTLNSQFLGAQPIQIDVGSFEAYSGGAWAGYTQFTRTFLNPLMLQALAGVPFQAWLRGEPGGLDAAQLGRLIPLRRRLRRDVLVHVLAQSWLERSLGQQVSRDIPSVNAHGRRTIERLLDQLEGSVRSLRRQGGAGSHWVTYATQCHYQPEAVTAKRGFVENALRAVRPSMVWDLGCNDGEYSLLAAEHAEHVIAMDFDEQSVGRLARRLEPHPDSRVLPLVMNLMNPSPQQGWGEREYFGLRSRGPADFVLCLALLHHLVIANNVPLTNAVDWLADHARAGVIEFVPQSDPMAQRMLRTRKLDLSAYTEAHFMQALEDRFRVIERLPLERSQRVLYSVARR